MDGYKTDPYYQNVGGPHMDATTLHSLLQDTNEKLLQARIDLERERLKNQELKDRLSRVEERPQRNNNYHPYHYNNQYRGYNRGGGKGGKGYVRIHQRIQRENRETPEDADTGEPERNDRANWTRRNRFREQDEDKDASDENFRSPSRSPLFE